MIALKIGIVIDGKKYETVFNASVLLAYLPGWVLRKRPMLSQKTQGH